jgi:hypothetical protein
VGAASCRDDRGWKPRPQKNLLGDDLNRRAAERHVEKISLSFVFTLCPMLFAHKLGRKAKR